MSVALHDGRSVAERRGDLIENMGTPELPQIAGVSAQRIGGRRGLDRERDASLDAGHTPPALGFVTTTRGPGESWRLAGSCLGVIGASGGGEGENVPNWRGSREARGLVTMTVGLGLLLGMSHLIGRGSETGTAQGLKASEKALLTVEGGATVEAVDPPADGLLDAAVKLGGIDGNGSVEGHVLGLMAGRDGLKVRRSHREREKG